MYIFPDEQTPRVAPAARGSCYGGDLQVEAITNTKQRMAVSAGGVAMIEREVRTIETSGTADIERAWNDLAQDGWRLANTAAANGAGTAAQVWLSWNARRGFHLRRRMTLPAKWRRSSPKRQRQPDRLSAAAACPKRPRLNHADRQMRGDSSRVWCL